MEKKEAGDEGPGAAQAAGDGAGAAGGAAAAPRGGRGVPAAGLPGRRGGDAAEEAEAVGLLRGGRGRHLRPGHGEGGPVLPAEERPRRRRRGGHQDRRGPGHDPVRRRTDRPGGQFLGQERAPFGRLHLRREPGRALQGPGGRGRGDPEPGQVQQVPQLHRRRHLPVDIL